MQNVAARLTLLRPCSTIRRVHTLNLWCLPITPFVVTSHKASQIAATRHTSSLCALRQSNHRERSDKLTRCRHIDPARLYSTLDVEGQLPPKEQDLGLLPSLRPQGQPTHLIRSDSKPKTTARTLITPRSCHSHSHPASRNPRIEFLRTTGVHLPLLTTSSFLSRKPAGQS